MTHVIRYREWPMDGEAWEIFTSGDIHKARRELARLIKGKREQGWFADVVKLRNQSGKLIQRWYLFKPGHPNLAESYFIETVGEHDQH